MKSITIALLALAGLTLGGCGLSSVLDDVMETGQVYAANGAAAAVINECKLSLAVRKDNAAKVNAILAEKGSPAKFMLDCEGDGPDF